MIGIVLTRKENYRDWSRMVQHTLIFNELWKGVCVGEGESDLEKPTSDKELAILENKKSKAFGMTQCNPLSTPLEQNIKLTSIEGKEFEDATKYRQLIGSLIYLTTTRPDISFRVGILSRFMQKPYFNGDKETGVSTSGYAMSLGSGVVSWRSCKQSILADSKTEAEYVAAGEATKEIVWLRKILEDLQVKQVQSTPIIIDNTSAIMLAKNPKFHDRTKHINTKYHLIRHHVEAKTIHLRHCSTNEKIAEIFTKAIGRENLERFRTMLGLTNIPSD
eukprot:PITA_25408